MADVPEAVAHGTVYWRAFEALGDGADSGTVPDMAGVTGTVTFRPGSATATALNINLPSEGSTMIVRRVIAKVIDGVLVGPEATTSDQPGVVLPASVQPLGEPGYFAWHVSFNLDGIPARSTPPNVAITVPASGMVNLVTVLSAPPTDEIGTRIAALRGAPGGLAGLDYEGDVIDARGNKVVGGGGGPSGPVAWVDVTGKPTFSPVATTGLYSDLEDAPVLADVALSGSYDDLDDKPTIPVVPATLPPTDGSVTPAKVASGYGLLSTSDQTKLTALPSDAQSNAQVTAIANARIAANRNVAGGVAGLDGSGKLSDSVLPPLAIGETFTVASQAAMLALTAQRGDIAIRTDLDPDGVFLLTADTPATLGAWVSITTAATVLSVAGRTGAVVLNKADVGLTAVDNTADADKPVSTAQATAIAARVAVGDVMPTLLADSATTVPPRESVITGGYTGPIMVDISDYPRSSTLDAAAVAVMLDKDRLRRRRA